MHLNLFLAHNGFFRFFVSISILLCASIRGNAKTIICDSSQSIAKILSGSNNTYIIQNLIDLGGETVIIGDNSILRFEGGSLANGQILMNYTLIDGNALFNNVGLKGKIKNLFIDFAWFGAKGDGVHDDTQAVQSAIDACASLDNITTVSGRDGIYLVSKPIDLSSNPKWSRHNISIVGRTKPNPNVRKGLNILGKTGDGKAIIDKIIEPYKGKIVYMDIWGTWCQPCINATKSSPKLKEAVKDYDIVYVYFAGQSEEIAWKGCIAELGLTKPNYVHYNLPQNQQDAVFKYLNLDGFPF